MKHAPTWALSLLIHLDPIPFGDSVQLGFSWVYEVLDFGYSGRKCVEMASNIVRLLGKRFYFWGFHAGARSTWILPPLLKLYR